VFCKVDVKKASKNFWLGLRHLRFFPWFVAANNDSNTIFQPEENGVKKGKRKNYFVKTSFTR